MTNLQNGSGKKIYEIKLRGHLNASWAEWFDGLTITHNSDGTTTLTGEIEDQAALHGFLKKVRDLGLPLISVNFLEQNGSKKAI